MFLEHALNATLLVEVVNILELLMAIINEGVSFTDIIEFFGEELLSRLFLYSDGRKLCKVKIWHFSFKYICLPIFERIFVQYYLRT